MKDVTLIYETCNVMGYVAMKCVRFFIRNMLSCYHQTCTVRYHRTC